MAAVTVGSMENLSSWVDSVLFAASLLPIVHINVYNDQISSTTNNLNKIKDIEQIFFWGDGISLLCLLTLFVCMRKC